MFRGNAFEQCNLNQMLRDVGPVLLAQLVHLNQVCGSLCTNLLLQFDPQMFYWVKDWAL